MKFLKRSARKNPKVSLILLDWSVRESFHILHYLRNQNVDRAFFEVVMIEYYSRESDSLKKLKDDIDTWVILEMPDSCIYHKHLMYNVGIFMSHGEIVVFCDSDAMVTESFIRAILDTFEKNERIVLHLDEFRNIRRDFYPFNFQSFEDVNGDGCINNINGKTSGIMDIYDPLHSVNYGACMCAKRSDIISIGGADEHIDYSGHICGPYDMTFRLVNYGCQEIWHESEFLYHTWHPGQAGEDNYLGPHDGRHMSTTALEALTTGRIMPLLENEAIRLLRNGTVTNDNKLENKLVDPEYYLNWKFNKVDNKSSFKNYKNIQRIRKYKGFRINYEAGSYYACLLADHKLEIKNPHNYNTFLKSDSLLGVKEKIDKTIPYLIGFASTIGFAYIFLWRGIEELLKILKKLFNKFTKTHTQITDKHAGLLTNGYVRTKNRLKQFFIEIKRLHRLIIDLIVNIYFIRNSNKPKIENEIPILLVDSRYLKYYLDFLTLVRILPKIKNIQCENRDLVRECLDELDRNEWNGRLFLGSNLYSKYHRVITSYEIGKNALII